MKDLELYCKSFDMKDHVGKYVYYKNCSWFVKRNNVLSRNVEPVAIGQISDKLFRSSDGHFVGAVLKKIDPI